MQRIAPDGRPEFGIVEACIWYEESKIPKHEVARLPSKHKELDLPDMNISVLYN